MLGIRSSLAGRFSWLRWAVLCGLLAFTPALQAQSPPSASQVEALEEMLGTMDWMLFNKTMEKVGWTLPNQAPYTPALTPEQVECFTSEPLAGALEKMTGILQRTGIANDFLTFDPVHGARPKVPAASGWESWYQSNVPAAGTTTGVININGVTTGTMKIGGGTLYNSTPGGIIDTDKTPVITTPNINSGDSGLIKEGTGTLTLTGNHTYAGPTSISEGTLTLNGLNGSTPTIESGGTISLTNPGTISLGGTGTESTGRAIIRFDSGTGSLTRTGAGTLTLIGSNTYEGATKIKGCTLSIATIPNGGIAGPLGASPAAASNLVIDGGTLQYTGSTPTSTASPTMQVVAGSGNLIVGDGVNPTVLTVDGITPANFSLAAGSKVFITPLVYGGAGGAPAPVPEPGTWALLAMAGLSLLLAAWRRK